MRKTIYILFLPLALFILIWWVNTYKFTSVDFRNNLWAPAYLIWHRSSAYDIVTLFPGNNAVWFPQIIGLFSLFGLMPLYPATNVWLVINIILLISLVWYLLWRVFKEKPRPLLFVIFTLIVFLFLPTYNHLILGQIDIIIMAAIIAGTLAIERDHITLGGFLFAISLVKPQLCVIVLPGVLYHLFFIKKEWLTAIKFSFLIIIFVLILATPLYLGNLNWFDDFISSLNRNPQWVQPSIFSQLHLRAGLPGVFLWLLIFIIIFILSLRLWKKFEPIRAVFWGLALTVIVSPYVWSWDFILVLPLFIDTALRLTNTSSRVILSAFFIFCFCFSVVSLQGINSNNSVLWWIPIELISGIIFSLLLSNRSKTSLFGVS